jgi:hypothetical protein
MTPGTTTQTNKTDATVLDFDVSRTRAGLRELMVEADARLHDAVDAGLWMEGDVTPEMIHNLLPDPVRLWSYDDAVVADLALKAALLSLHAIQTGCWPDDSEHHYFTEMQRQALRVKYRLEAQL